MRRVMLFTGHYHASARRAGFHWLANAYHRLGWDVTFVTTSLSWLSVARRDFRLAYPVRAEAGRMVEVRPGFRSFVHFAPYHPANLRRGWLNAASSPLFARYGRRLPRVLEAAVAEAGLLIFESTPGLLLFERCRGLNPAARTVYRVSDDLRLLQNHPAVIAAERRIAPRFDLVSVPSSYMAGLFPGLENIQLQLHGLELEAFDGEHENPYEPGTVNLVFVGNSHFDHDFLRRALAQFPGYRFHVIGPIEGLPESPNLVAYGEMPFAATVPYLQHASAGLQTLAYRPGAESFSDSLKVLQYTYCGLGVVAPDFLDSPRANVFHYQPGDDASIGAAIEAALGTERTAVDRSGIHSWDELAEELAA